MAIAKKFDERDRRIYALWASGKAYIEIAKRTGLNSTHIKQICEEMARQGRTTSTPQTINGGP